MSRRRRRASGKERKRSSEWDAQSAAWSAAPVDTDDAPVRSPAAGEAATTSAAQARVVTPSNVAVQVQVLFCGLLCACGATLAAVTTLREVAYHVVPPGPGVAWAVATLCLGVALGLWMPRRVIQRRLQRRPSAVDAELPIAPEAGPVRLEFAASLAGGLMVVFGLACVVLCGGVVFMEDYRAFVARRFLHPAELTYVLLLAPAYAMLVLVAVAGATLMVALHGWYRLTSPPPGRLVHLWAGLLVGATAAGLLVWRVAPITLLAWLAPLVVFVAAVISVARRSDAVGTPTAPLVPHQRPRGELLLLLTAGLAAAMVGSALFLALPYAWMSTQRLGATTAILPAAACAGMLLARLLLRARLGKHLPAALLLLAALALLLPERVWFGTPAAAALARLATTTFCAAACVALVSHRAVQLRRSVQYALSWVGRFVAGGFGLALAASGLLAALWNPPKPQVVASPGVTNEPLVAAARRLVVIDEFHKACVRPLPPRPGADVWQFDLAGPALDVVVTERVSGVDDWPLLDADWGQRLLKRLTTRLAHGGRLVVELPTAPCLAAALRRPNWGTYRPAWTGYRLSVRNATDQYAALVFGGDIPELLARQTPPAELDVSLEPLRTGTDAER